MTPQDRRAEWIGWTVFAGAMLALAIEIVLWTCFR